MQRIHEEIPYVLAIERLLSIVSSSFRNAHETFVKKQVSCSAARVDHAHCEQVYPIIGG